MLIGYCCESNVQTVIDFFISAHKDLPILFLALPILLPLVAIWVFLKTVGRTKALIFLGCTAALFTLNWYEHFRRLDYYREKNAAAAMAGTLIENWVISLFLAIGSIVVWTVVFLVIAFVPPAVRRLRAGKGETQPS